MLQFSQRRFQFELIRQKNDPKMIRFRMIEAGALNKQDIGFDKNVVDQPFIIGNAKLLRIDFRKEVERAEGVDARKKGNGFILTVKDITLQFQSYYIIYYIVVALISD